MTSSLLVEKILQFDEISTEWSLVNISLDWNGHPLLLFEEGRRPFPFIASEELASRYQTVPIAHHIVYFDHEQPVTVTIQNAVGAKRVSFVQRFEEGWLLVEARGGAGHLYSEERIYLKRFNFGDAINDVQTTLDGQIWISYFDEGVFGNGIGTNGLVCFNSQGQDIFRYAEFAEITNLSHIDDCYALNVFRNSVWLSYYSDFPLVQISDFSLQRRLNGFGSFSAFAVRGENVLALPSYRRKHLKEISLSDRSERQIDPADDMGIRLADFKGRLYKERFANTDTETLEYYKPFQGTARGSKMYLYTEDALFRVP